MKTLSRSVNMSDHIELAKFLFVRLHQLGVGSIHGVPGDFNLTILDYVEPAGLTWVGSANELNAAYAADGYARIKGISALITTFGVGELSAINGIAGAYAERSPVVHIVGTPSTAMQDAGTCLHHSLGDGDLRVYSRLYKSVTVAQTNLRDPKSAPQQVDAILRQCILESRPVYIELPTDMVSALVPCSVLESPIDLTVTSSQELHDADIDAIIERIHTSKQPFIIVDGFASRYGIVSEVNELVRITGIPTATTPFGKGIVNEAYPNFYGLYEGVIGTNIPITWAEKCDLILRIAPLNSNVNTLSFSTIPEAQRTITFNKDSINICDTTTFRDVDIKAVFQAILQRMPQDKLPHNEVYPQQLHHPLQELTALPEPTADGVVDQGTFYRRISSFFRPHDIILAETGTASIGSREFILPEKTQLLNSSIWLSIGFMLPAAQGVALAQRELGASGKCLPGRVILFEGDGSFQMTSQAISDIVRNRLNVTVFLLNNDGYTIERLIHGMSAHYNDIQPWRYLQSASYFGAPEDDESYPVTTRRVGNWGQLMNLMRDEDFSDGKGFKMAEILMAKDDAVESLKTLVNKAKSSAQ
ncbi:hypothetical protein LTR84_011226 [Exophiala bonariae]|uniref:Pyruvate decarboxylase n=1 Tax=Exophiala bonariae TaxID=1690606 RepID=A0AAV9NJL1_9EURO|nr:hypothetical protein LTR84_011226 [Exophiala bonariae]